MHFRSDSDCGKLIADAIIGKLKACKIFDLVLKLAKNQVAEAKLPESFPEDGGAQQKKGQPAA